MDRFGFGDELGPELGLRGGHDLVMSNCFDVSLGSDGLVGRGRRDVVVQYADPHHGLLGFDFRQWELGGRQDLGHGPSSLRNRLIQAMLELQLRSLGDAGR